MAWDSLPTLSQNIVKGNTLARYYTAKSSCLKSYVPRGGNVTPSLLSLLGSGSVRLCYAMKTDLLNSPSLLANPKYTFCPKRYCCKVLTTDRNNRTILHNFQTQGGNEYIVHSAQLAGSFGVLRQNLQQVARNQGRPHTTLCLLGS
jgi:hypothetical protein